jgi:drug/metabolite transporter (DMT)-like permease
VIRSRVLVSGPGYIFAATCLWGAYPFVIAIAGREIMPGEMVAVRMLAAGLLLGVVLKPAHLFQAVRNHWLAFLTLSLLGVAVPNLLFVHAVRITTNIPVLTFVSSSYPVWAIVLAVVFLRERPSVIQLAGVVCTLMGLFLMAGLAEGGAHLAPDAVLALLASLGWASASVISKHMTMALDTTTIVAGRHLLSGLLLCPVVLAEGIRLPQAGALTWLAMAIMVILSILSYQLYYRGLVQTSVASASLIEGFNPVVTWVLGAAFFEQGLTPMQWISAGLLLAGTLSVSLQGLRRHA